MKKGDQLFYCGQYKRDYEYFREVIDLLNLEYNRLIDTYQVT